MIKDVISFKDFISNKFINESAPILNDDSFDEEDDVKDYSFEQDDFEETIEVYQENEKENLNDQDVENKQNFDYDEDDEDDSLESNLEFENTNTNYYKLYQDVNENFSCDIHIDGADTSKVTTRLVIESDDWNIMFLGEVENGKCIIPVKKLNILKEGQIGKIKLEVLADGVVFIPWEDNFKVFKKVKISNK
jgi:hypothetical protein